MEDSLLLEIERTTRKYRRLQKWFDAQSEDFIAEFGWMWQRKLAKLDDRISYLLGDN